MEQMFPQEATNAIFNTEKVIRMPDMLGPVQTGVAKMWRKAKLQQLGANILNRRTRKAKVADILP
jgi:hypothetical protein